MQAIFSVSNTAPSLCQMGHYCVPFGLHTYILPKSMMIYCERTQKTFTISMENDSYAIRENVILFISSMWFGIKKNFIDDLHWN